MNNIRKPKPIHKHFHFYENVLEESEFDVLHDIFETRGWTFQKSLDVGHTFLVMHLSDHVFFYETIFNKIKLLTKTDFELGRVYANCQFFGMPGLPHCDHKPSKQFPNDGTFFTFLIYLNNIWPVTWGGQTVFFNKFLRLDDSNKLEEGNKYSNEIYVQYPTYNLGILFPSDMMHYAESPTQICTEQRITIAYKLRKINKS